MLDSMSIFASFGDYLIKSYNFSPEFASNKFLKYFIAKFGE